MAKDCVFKVAARRHPGMGALEVAVVKESGLTLLRGYMSPSEWSAFRSGLMPNSHVDFIIEEEEDGKRSD